MERVPVSHQGIKQGRPVPFSRHQEVSLLPSVSAMNLSMFLLMLVRFPIHQCLRVLKQGDAFLSQLSGKHGLLLSDHVSSISALPSCIDVIICLSYVIYCLFVAQSRGLVWKIMSYKSYFCVCTPFPPSDCWSDLFKFFQYLPYNSAQSPPKSVIMENPSPPAPLHC